VRRARFLVDGETREGELTEPGVLRDGAGREYREEDVEFLLPFEPRMVLGLALNYADHASELEVPLPPDPIPFIKPPSSLIPHGAPVVYPAGAEYMHYEAELCVVIGRAGRRVRAADAMELVAGYTLGNDVTVRDYVGNYYRPPLLAKGWDTFGPLGPYLVTADEVPDPNSLGIRTFVNGELRQEGNTRDFVHGIPELIEWFTAFMTLQPGDVIMTGTPKGISHVYAGDVMRVEADGIGSLENPVVADTLGGGPA
jgi:5-oxopent-3-ene-1,2,5-tricarboxylate decarboxylase/2-hydroxyhepta-2,4-diene-1,7-dioate isomerase